MRTHFCIYGFILAISIFVTSAFADTSEAARARDLGIPFEGQPGPLNAITDVAGVEVGHVTLVRGEGACKLASVLYGRV